MFNKEMFIGSYQRIIVSEIETYDVVAEMIEKNISQIHKAFESSIDYLESSQEQEYFTLAKRNIHKAISCSNILYCPSLAEYFVSLEVSDDIEWEFINMKEIEGRLHVFKQEALPQIRLALKELKQFDFNSTAG